MPKKKHADCADDCCDEEVVCFTVCAEQSETLQLSVPDETFITDTETLGPCEETRCDERCGEHLLTKVAEEDLATEWPPGVPTYTPDAGHCMWAGEEFETCRTGAYDDEELGPQPEVVITLRWCYVTVPSSEGLHDCYAVLEAVSGTWEYFVWYVVVSDDRECDPLDLEWLSQPGAFNDGCQVDETEVVTVSLPP